MTRRSCHFPELTLTALRPAVATLVPSRLLEFFNDMQTAFVRAGEEDTATPIRMFTAANEASSSKSNDTHSPQPDSTPPSTRSTTRTLMCGSKKSGSLERSDLQSAGRAASIVHHEAIPRSAGPEPNRKAHRP